VEDLNVSEQRNEATSGEADSVSAGPIGSEVPAANAAETSASETTEAAALAPEQGGADAASVAATDAAKPGLDPAEPGSRTVTIIPPSQRRSSGKKSWNDDFAAERDPEPATAQAGLFGKRRLSAIAAVIVLSAVAGAVGGALATAGLSHFNGDDGASIQTKVQDEQILRLQSELAALKSNVEHTAKLSVTQISKTAERIDKIEKAQAEPAAKIARLTETVDKLRAAPAPVAAAPTPAPTPVAAAPAPAAKEVTGSISAPSAATPKPEVARLPTVQGWVLRDVADGGAVIEGRSGVFEVYAGDPVPGLGRVDAIRRQDGRWVVVTSRGLIVAR
jgi:hypothetical protein